MKSATRNTTQLMPTARKTDPTMERALAIRSLWDLARWRHSSRWWVLGAVKQAVDKAVDNRAAKYRTTVPPGDRVFQPRVSCLGNRPFSPRTPYRPGVGTASLTPRWARVPGRPGPNRRVLRSSLCAQLPRETVWK